MSDLEERLLQDEALRLECVRLAVSAIQGSKTKWSDKSLVSVAGKLEAFIRGAKK
jgi:hypothetical protein